MGKMPFEIGDYRLDLGVEGLSKRSPLHTPPRAISQIEIE
jgi:hypothetical protein